MAAPELLNVHEAAEYLRLNEHTVRRLARRHEIPAFKVCSEWRFRRSTLHQWASSQELLQNVQDILVVDDEAFVRESIGRALERAGFPVRTARDGREALEAMELELPDLVLLDLKMPGMDGPELMAHIREKWGDLPVVILTGYPESDLVEQALRFSPITLLTKDAPSDAVVAAVKAHVFQRWNQAESA